MSIFRKNLEENTLPASITTLIYVAIMYFCNISKTPLMDGLLFFLGYMTSSYFITKIKSNPDEKKVKRNMLIYSVSVLSFCVISLILLSILKS